MGERALDRPQIKPQATSKLRRRNYVATLPVDVPLLLIISSLLVVGMLMVYSSSWDASLLIKQPTTFVFSRQVVFVAVGIMVALVLSVIDYHVYGKVVVLMMLGVVVILLSVLIFGDIRYNSQRTLFNGSVQPGELAKMGIIIYLSFWLSGRKEELKSIKDGFIPLLLIISVVAGLIIAQPDISAAGTIAILGVLLYYVAGGDWKQLLLIMVGGIAVGFLVYKVMPTAQARIHQLIDGMNDPMQSSYHIQRTYEAIIKGRIFGVGLGQATTKFTGLPLAHTDSIFAVIVEETGLLGAFIVMGLYAGMVWRGMVIARRAPDQLGALLAFGLLTWIGLEAIINVAVIAGLFPFAGNSLPLISAGGSSMLTTMAAIGIAMNVARQGVTKESAERSQQNATVDLRWRDGRRRVPRTDGSGALE